MISTAQNDRYYHDNNSFNYFSSLSENTIQIILEDPFIDEHILTKHDFLYNLLNSKKLSDDFIKKYIFSDFQNEYIQAIDSNQDFSVEMFELFLKIAYEHDSSNEPKTMLIDYVSSHTSANNEHLLDIIKQNINLLLMDDDALEIICNCCELPISFIEQYEKYFIPKHLHTIITRYCGYTENEINELVKKYSTDIDKNGWRFISWHFSLSEDNIASNLTEIDFTAPLYNNRKYNNPEIIIYKKFY